MLSSLKCGRLQQQGTDNRVNLFFCHFRDLYDGWRKGDHGRSDSFDRLAKIQPLSSVNPTFLVEDKRVIDKAIEAGVATELEASQGHS